MHRTLAVDGRKDLEPRCHAVGLQPDTVEGAKGAQVVMEKQESKQGTNLFT